MRYAYSLMLLSLATWVAAQEADAQSLPAGSEINLSEMEEIVVTASRRPDDISSIGSSISVITAPEIERRQYRLAVDAVEALPGVTINQNGSFGGSASVRIRGATTDQTLVIVDGVVVGDPSSPGGGFNFANVRVEDIARIEVLRGPQSTLFGSDAIGGVINIITKRGDGAPSASAFVEGGAYESFSGGASLFGSTGIFDYRASIDASRTDGISKADIEDGNTEDDGYRNLTVSGTIGVEPSEWLRVEGSARYSDSRNEFDVFGSATGVEDGDQVGLTDEFILNGKAVATALEGRMRNDLSVGYSETDRENFRDGTQSFLASGERLTFEYLGSFDVSENVSVLFGAETEETTIKTASVDDDITIDSFLGELRASPADGLILSAGIRHDDHETFGGVTTFRFTGAYDLASTGTVLRASWGEGFKAPSPFQLTFSCCGLPPNPGLLPEESDGWDASVEQSFFEDRASVQVTYFRQNTGNQIDFVFGQGGYINIDETRQKGVEVVVTADLADWLFVDANYSYIDAEDHLTGDQLGRIPKDTASVNITVTPLEALSVSTGLTYNGKEPDSRGTVDDWTRVDLRASYAILEDVEIYGRIENLFDADYQEIFGYGTPELSAYAGVRARF